uniref:Chondroitin proteoglycan 4 domain-containing protein n=1 Tax=Romanomermis culicivorax TaxID=13658 RepID=A0A915HYW3_ROMCU
MMAVFQSNCTVKCSQQLDRDFNKTYNGKKNSTAHSNQAISQVSSNEYSVEELDTLCKAYMPSSKCIKACPSYEMIKPMMLDMLTMLEYMCVTNNKDLKQQIPCVTKHRKEIRDQCDPKCAKYESAIDEVLEKSKLENVNDKVLKSLQKNFNDSCSYIQCMDKCQTPLITKLCGSATATTVENLFLAMFHSIKSILNSVNMVRDSNTTVSLSLVCNGLPHDPFI